MIDVLERLRTLQKMKEDAHIHPSFVTMQELLKRIDDDAVDELRNLVKTRKVVHHQTLNSHSFGIIETNDDRV